MQLEDWDIVRARGSVCVRVLHAFVRQSVHCPERADAKGDVSALTWVQSLSQEKHRVFDASTAAGTDSQTHTHAHTHTHTSSHMGPGVLASGAF